MKYTILAMSAAILTTPVWTESPSPPPEIPALASYEPECKPVSISVYFAEDSADITPQARKALETTIDEVDGCVVTKIETTTISEDADANSGLLKLSENRADNVLEAIASTGIWAEEVQSDIVLARSTNRPDTAARPLARRVEIEFTTAWPITS